MCNSRRRSQSGGYRLNLPLMSTAMQEQMLSVCGTTISQKWRLKICWPMTLAIKRKQLGNTVEGGLSQPFVVNPALRFG